MCGRYALFAPPDELAERFSVPAPETSPTYNAAPSQNLPIIPDDAEEIRLARWGLTPEWADEQRDLINARAETMAEKPSFKDAKRCLVPANGFYEWVEADGGKRPYYVTRRDGEPFAMAGLRTRWEPPTKQTGLDSFSGGDPDSEDPAATETFAVVTTEPNEVVERLHHRMAVILSREREREWLSGEPFSLVPAEELRAYPVSTAVNSPGNDSPELVREVADV
ncbi:SOS response-associated peptidase [Halalkalicoccus sp. NIPERK01]|uniref:SOS response-associated peptidase n=1 Tax=Halalkalicoccus sp. NIPERK01 TaxID=3053469 RepID=UPI00256E9D9E|nr:SOS response-associated peptidase [Halalkalicoccus sp. NIPERK01]MDL5362589.1 SOS response-associated peptidase [Halalkalicoccus sp. NIPERK01]